MSLRRRYAVVAAARRYRYWADRPGAGPRIMRAISRVILNVWNQRAACEVLPGARIGENVVLPHPNGIVIHQASSIGDDCMIMQQVTIGQKATGGAPTIGNRVYIGAGAKILGPIHIGDGAKIGANAVVLQDVPAGWMAAGVPAKLRAPKQEQ